MKKLVFYSLWVIVAFFALCLAIIAIQYFTFESDYNFLKAKQEMLGNKIWLVSFYVHLFFGVICVLTGLILFFGKLIPFASNNHRRIGKLYILSILFFTGPTGFYLSFYAEGGPLASVGFICMSFFWMLYAWMAINKAIQKDLEGHYKWVIRSFAFTLSGVTLRLYTPFGVQVLGLDYETNFIISAYVPWIINMGLTEIIILFNQQKLKNLNTLINRI